MDGVRPTRLAAINEPQAVLIMSDRLLAWLDEDRCRSHIERARKFWAGEGRHVISLTTPKHRPRQDTPDEERFQIHLASLEHQASLPGLNVPSVFPDYGTIRTARCWGGEVRVAEETGNPHIAPVAASIDEALALEPLPLGDARMDTARALKLFRRLNEALETDQLWFRAPDMQGPLNTAGLVLKQDELLMAMHGEPGKARQFLHQVTSFLVDLWRYLQRECDGRFAGSIWPYTFVPADLGVVFTEDLMPLLSADVYREFGIPLLRRIADEFGSLHIHCCGRWGHHVQNLKRSGLPLRSLEFHWPFTKLEELEPLAETAVFIPYIALDQQNRFKSVSEFYRHLIEKTETKFRFWFACADDSAEMTGFVERYGQA